MSVTVGVPAPRKPGGLRPALRGSAWGALDLGVSGPTGGCSLGEAVSWGGCGRGGAQPGGSVGRLAGRGGSPQMLLVTRRWRQSSIWCPELLVQEMLPGLFKT